MPSVFKRKGCVSWRISYVNAAGENVEVNSGCKQKSNAMKLALEFEKEAEDMRARGITEVSGSAPWQETVEKYLTSVAAKGRSKETLRNKRVALEAVQEAC